MGLCKIVGFEPQPQAYENLKNRDAEIEIYFPYAIGKTGATNLNIYRGSGFTSTYKIDEETIRFLNNPGWYNSTRLVESISMESISLDNVPDLPRFDLLKIDIQGGELDVFKNAKNVLESAICIVPEVSFFPLYENAPNFADIHNELISQGFLLHKFMFQKQVHIYSSLSANKNISRHSNQLIDGDAVYIRDPRKIHSYNTDMLKKFFLLTCFVFDSKDLSLLILEELVKRREITEGFIKKFASLI